MMDETMQYLDYSRYFCRNDVGLMPVDDVNILEKYALSSNPSFMDISLMERCECTSIRLARNTTSFLMNMVEFIPVTFLTTSLRYTVEMLRREA